MLGFRFPLPHPSPTFFLMSSFHIIGQSALDKPVNTPVNAINIAFPQKNACSPFPFMAFRLNLKCWPSFSTTDICLRPNWFGQELAAFHHQRLPFWPNKFHTKSPNDATPADEVRGERRQRNNPKSRQRLSWPRGNLLQNDWGKADTGEEPAEAAI